MSSHHIASSMLLLYATVIKRIHDQPIPVAKDHLNTFELGQKWSHLEVKRFIFWGLIMRLKYALDAPLSSLSHTQTYAPLRVCCSTENHRLDVVHNLGGRINKAIYYVFRLWLVVFTSASTETTTDWMCCAVHCNAINLYIFSLRFIFMRFSAFGRGISWRWCDSPVTCPMSVRSCTRIGNHFHVNRLFLCLPFKLPTCK